MTYFFKCNWLLVTYFVATAMVLVACDPSAILLAVPDVQQKPAQQEQSFSFDFSISADDEVPNAESLRIVRAVSKPSIKGFRYTYNSSIINYDEHHFLMVFRVDVGELDPVYPVTRMGIVKLDENLNQVGETRFIVTGFETAEDARIFKKGDAFWIVFNARLDDKQMRAMYIAELRGLENETDNIVVEPVLLDFDANVSQKNWTPFVFKDTIYLSYSLTPHKVLRYDEAKKKVELVYTSDSVHLPDQWPFGDIRGGTPGIMRGDEYLAFYHSNFIRNGHRWYVFGAYTFEAKPPFRLRRVAEKPIYFRDSYSSILQPHIGAVNRVIFPAGVARAGSRILVSYGDNDSQTKIVTLDDNQVDELFQKQNDKSKNLKVFEPDENIGVSLPSELKTVHFLDEAGVVKNIKRVVLFDAALPFDGSLLSFEDGYLMAYSVAVDEEHPESGETGLQLVRLDRNFIQLSPSRAIRCYARSPKAPKLFWKGTSVYLTFNATRDLFYGKRCVYAGPLEGLHGVDEIVFKKDVLRFGYEFHQESWSPFSDNQSVFFSYLVEPHTVLTLNEKNQSVSLLSSSSPVGLQWRFGQPEGGTPAIKWHNEYLSFFQSTFVSRGYQWTVMGAYTFENVPPFRVTRMTKDPIMLRDFYTTTPSRNTSKTSRSVLPSGLVVDNGVIRVSYGENEGAVKIMELDEDEFAKLLVRVHVQ